MFHLWRRVPRGMWYCRGDRKRGSGRAGCEVPENHQEGYRGGIWRFSREVRPGENRRPIGIQVEGQDWEG